MFILEDVEGNVKMLAPCVNFTEIADGDGLFPHTLLSRSDSFQYSLEASMSVRSRQGDGPMAYLNRGQFYSLTLSAAGFMSSLRQPSGKSRARGPTASHGPDGSAGERCAAGGSELQRDSMVQVREGRWHEASL